MINFGGSKQAARWLDSEGSTKRSWQFRFLMVDVRKMTRKKKKRVALAMWMELNGAVDAPRRGPAAGNASRRDRWDKEGGLGNIYYKLLLLFANSSFEKDSQSRITLGSPEGGICAYNQRSRASRTG